MPAGRPRQFDREAALEQAMMVFWEHGYDATSIGMLTGALGIGAPSLYAAFGDKRALFGEALERYLATYGAFTIRDLQEESRARRAIERLLRDAAGAYTREGYPQGCMLITAATNCSPQSADIQARLREFRAAGRLAVERKLADAKQAGELPADADTRGLAAFFSATLQGMSALARDGGSRQDLEQVAAVALRAW